MCVLLCASVLRKDFLNHPLLVYLFSLMIVFLILAWLHSNTAVDCTALSLQMTSIWTVSIWHAFIYVGSRKAIFRWVSHFLSSFVELTDQTLQCSFNPLSPNSLAVQTVPDFWGQTASSGKYVMHTCMHTDTHYLDLFWGNLELTIAPPSVCSACHLSEKGQGMQTLHSARHWREFLILLPLI